MLDFQVPRITSESVEANRGSFTIEPLDRGFGYTFGNSLRRVLLSSLAGAAVTSVRIEGVAHEFSTIKGVKEDVTDIVLNLKGVVCRMHTDATEIEAPLVVTGPGDIAARDIDVPAGVEVLNPDAHIATLESGTKLEMYLTIGRGRGYRPADENKSPDQPIVTDADRVEELRAGPGGQLESAAVGSNGASAATGGGPMDDILIEELELGVRSYNCLKRAGIQTVGDLVSKSEGELNAIPNFGKKSIDEVIETLHARGLNLRDD
jgi:DNA-directed RNA polymerase subunit alpha